MLKRNRIAAVPDYVLFNYSHFITDNEFLVIMALGVTSDWKEAARKMGYSNSATISRAVSSMKEKGLVTVSNQEVDVGVLWEKCRERSYKPKKAVMFEDKEEKSVGYKIHSRLVQKGVLSGAGKEKHVWANSLKAPLKKGVSPEDIVGCAVYLNSLFMNHPRFSEYKPDITPNRVISNIEKWIDGGRKKAYIFEEEDFSELERELDG